MSGTIVVNKSLTGRGQKNWIKTSVDGVKGEKVRGMLPVEVKAEPGAHKLRVSSGGFRTNEVTLDVKEGVRHQVTVASTSLEALMDVPFLGALGVLILGAIPGSVYRITVS